MKWNLLPHAQSDYIFAIIGEELGFLGCLVVVTLYGVLAYAGFRIARRSADRFVQLASVAITVWLIGQAAMNMGYVVGLLPVTGVQLPLISAGGTSLVLTLFIVGLLARFARSEPAAIEAQRGRDARPAGPAPPARARRGRRRRAPPPPAGGAAVGPPGRRRRPHRRPRPSRSAPATRRPPAGRAPADRGRPPEAAAPRCASGPRPEPAPARTRAPPAGASRRPGRAPPSRGSAVTDPRTGR